MTYDIFADAILLPACIAALLLYTLANK